MSYLKQKSCLLSISALKYYFPRKCTYKDRLEQAWPDVTWHLQLPPGPSLSARCRRCCSWILTPMFLCPYCHSLTHCFELWHLEMKRQKEFTSLLKRSLTTGNHFRREFLNKSSVHAQYFQCEFKYHLLEAQVTALSLIISNQNTIPGFLETFENLQRTFWR